MVKRKPKLTFKRSGTSVDESGIMRAKPGEAPILFASRSYTEEEIDDDAILRSDDGPALLALVRHQPVKYRDGSPVRLWRRGTLFIRNMALNIETHSAEIKDGLWKLEAEGRLDRYNTEFFLHEEGAPKIHDDTLFPDWYDIADQIRWNWRSHKDYRIVFEDGSFKQFDFREFGA